MTYVKTDGTNGLLAGAETQLMCVVTVIKYFPHP